MNTIETAILMLSILSFITLITLYNRFSGWILFVTINAIFWTFLPKALYFTVPFSLILLISNLRKFTISLILLKIIRAKNLLPQISETEDIALNAGTVWVEGEFFTGKPDFTRIIKEPYSEISQEEQDFLNNEVEELCNMVTDQKIQELQDLPTEVWNYIRSKKFFGMIIPKEYGGLAFSPLAQSKIVAKLATRSQVLSITVMVPNSLGPAELILKYGTKSQKNFYIPRLANGTDIPCFALTEPTAGSDAASIGAYGDIFMGEDGKLKVKLNFQKRYITLGGIATVLGLAFKMNDPHHLLPPHISTGITCALIDGNTEGLTRGRRHKPMGVPFINSPLWGKNIVIDIEEGVIGGMEGVGKGWKMLMECLAVGRGISLPAISYGGSILASYVAIFHASIRKQFGLPLIKFEAIQEKIADMFAKTYAIDAMRTFVASAVGYGHTPSIANAIVKYHATEHSRDIINHGMDILAGSAICMGEKNLIANLYLASPIGITVEGANVLTRSLLQFGQGVIRCHPYILNEIRAIKDSNLHEFDQNLWKHASSFASNCVRTFFLGLTSGRFSRPIQSNVIQKYNAKLNYISARFATLTDYAMITYGGALKRKEFLSSRFADITSYMFLMSSVLKKFSSGGFNESDKATVEYICDLYLSKIQEAFYDINTNILRKNALAAILNLSGAFSKKTLVEQRISWDNIESIVKHYSQNHAIAIEEVFIPKNSEEQMHKMVSAFLQQDVIDIIDKRIRKSGYKKPEDALKNKVISQSEFEEITNYNTLCNEIIQVDNFELKSLVNEN